MRGLIRTLRGALALAAAVAIVLAGCGNSSPRTNVVAAYLDHADRQYETSGQRDEIVRALRDMLDRSPSELRARRYADYEGHAGAWPVTTLLEKYFVPTGAVRTLPEDAFYRDVGKPEAKAAIRGQLSTLEKESAAH